MAKYFAIMPDTCCDLSKKFQEEYDIEVLYTAGPRMSNKLARYVRSRQFKARRKGNHCAKSV